MRKLLHKQGFSLSGREGNFAGMVRTPWSARGKSRVWLVTSDRRRTDRPSQPRPHAGNSHPVGRACSPPTPITFLYHFISKPLSFYIKNTGMLETLLFPIEMEWNSIHFHTFRSFQHFTSISTLSAHFSTFLHI